MELSLLSAAQPLRHLIAPSVMDCSCCRATAQSLLFRCCGQIGTKRDVWSVMFESHRFTHSITSKLKSDCAWLTVESGLRSVNTSAYIKKPSDAIFPPLFSGRLVLLNADRILGPHGPRIRGALAISLATVGTARRWL
jgi:hypothetical protein